MLEYSCFLTFVVHENKRLDSFLFLSRTLKKLNKTKTNNLEKEIVCYIYFYHKRHKSMYMSIKKLQGQVFKTLTRKWIEAKERKSIAGGRL